MIPYQQSHVHHLSFGQISHSPFGQAHLSLKTQAAHQAVARSAFKRRFFEILSENYTDLSTQDSEGHPCQGQHELPCAAAVILPVIAGSIKKQESRPEYRPQKASHRKHQGFYLAKKTPDNYGAGIPPHEAETLARVLFLMMQKFFEREEGQREGGVESPTECRAAETGMTKAGAS